MCICNRIGGIHWVLSVGHARSPSEIKAGVRSVEIGEFTAFDPGKLHRVNIKTKKRFHFPARPPAYNARILLCVHHSKIANEPYSLLRAVGRQWGEITGPFVLRRPDE